MCRFGVSCVCVRRLPADRGAECRSLRLRLEAGESGDAELCNAFIGAHEAVTQIPRLQTFGQSSRMTEQQMQAALKMLPQPGDDAAMMKQKINSLAVGWVCCLR